MLAPLIETVILLDRKLYLLEKGKKKKCVNFDLIHHIHQSCIYCYSFLGISCKILSAFDPEISPRNQLLISDKSLQL